MAFYKIVSIFPSNISTGKKFKNIVSGSNCLNKSLNFLNNINNKNEIYFSVYGKEVSEDETNQKY